MHGTVTISVGVPPCTFFILYQWIPWNGRNNAMWTHPKMCFLCGLTSVLVKSHTQVKGIQWTLSSFILMNLLYLIVATKAIFTQVSFCLSILIVFPFLFFRWLQAYTVLMDTNLYPYIWNWLPLTIIWCTDIKWPLSPSDNLHIDIGFIEILILSGSQLDKMRPVYMYTFKGLWPAQPLFCIVEVLWEQNKLPFYRK